MWKLHRYYLKEVLVSAGITFLVLFAVILVSLVYRGIQRSQGGDAFDALKITLFWALDSFPHLLTISFLIATVLTFTRAAQDRELVAIRAAGVSPFVPMSSALLVGLGLTFVGSLVMHYALPEVHFRKYRVIAGVVRSVFMNMQLGSDRIALPGGYVLTYREHEGAEFRDCTIYCKKPVAGFESPILFVDRVQLPEIEEGMTEFVIALDGIRDPIGTSGTPGRMQIGIPGDFFAGAEGRDERDDDLRSDQLLGEVLRGVHPAPEGALYTLFRRCCFSVMPALLAPIGYCLAELARDRGRVFALMSALAPLAVFYLGEVLGARLLLSTSSPWCGWLPAALLVAFGAPLCWRQLRR